jgi:RimJ/RimL family protein N-acetyltransferase
MSITLKSSETLTIRLALPSDAARIITYVQSVGDESDFLTFSGSEFNKTIAEEEAIIQDHLDTHNKIFIVGEINGQIVSILNAGGKQKPRLRHVIEFGVSVRKDHCDKGIGRHMVEYLISWGKNNDIVKKINLMVVEHNLGALKLYEQLGFEYEGRLRKDFYEGGKYYDGLAMGLEV